VARPMTNEPSSEAHSDKVWIIDAVCINCNKRFTSMHGVSMHLKMTGSCHVMNFINHGNYDKKTGLEMNRPELGGCHFCGVNLFLLFLSRLHS
jgi:hypothetical protein